MREDRGQQTANVNSLAVRTNSGGAAADGGPVKRTPGGRRMSAHFPASIGRLSLMASVPGLVNPWCLVLEASEICNEADLQTGAYRLDGREANRPYMWLEARAGIKLMGRELRGVMRAGGDQLVGQYPRTTPLGGPAGRVDAR